jgi:hypothetical protein
MEPRDLRRPFVISSEKFVSFGRASLQASRGGRRLGGSLALPFHPLRASDAHRNFVVKDSFSRETPVLVVNYSRRAKPEAGTAGLTPNRAGRSVRRCVSPGS